MPRRAPPQRRERDFETFRHALEGEADLEGLLRHREIPELVLEDDRHLFGIAFAQALGYLHARRTRVERDVEVVLAHEAVLCRVGENTLNHAAQCLLGQEIVADMVGRHDGLD